MGAVALVAMACAARLATESTNFVDCCGLLYAYLATWEVGPFVAYLLAAGIWLATVCSGSRRTRRTPNRRLPAFCTCTLLGWTIAAGFGWKSRDLPPTYHDEYAYRFQAETFLAGRMTGAALPADLADCFDQPHLLTSPFFASRYYPGTALFFAPFVALGMPWLANWFAAGLAAGFTARAGWRWSPGIGWTAGLMMATAPATVAFGNMQLSVMPTVLGLAIFLDAYLEGIESGNRSAAMTAGWAMAFAFITRPLTAVGIGFPFACHALSRLRRPVSAHPGIDLRALVLTFATGPLLLATYNGLLTGNPLRSPYGLYMAERTPSQQYGFYNKSRGQAARTDKTFVAYDNWSEDLRPREAPSVVANRWLGLFRWSLGMLPAAVLATLVVLRLPRMDEAAGLLFLACIGLSLAYAPYWFVGLLGFSYLAEALPFFLLLVAGAGWKSSPAAHSREPIVWLGMIALAAVVNLAAQLPTVFAPGSELIAPRLQAAERERLERKLLAQAAGKKLLLLVDALPADSLHETLVHNSPMLDGAVVRAWNLEGKRQRLLEHFADRAAYLWKPGGAVIRLR